MRGLPLILSGALGLLAVGCGGIESQGPEGKEWGNSSMETRGDALLPDGLGSVTGSPVTQGNTCGRPNEVTPSCGSSSASEHAYTWTAPYTGTFTFTTTGSSFDTILQVTDLVTGASLGCNDDSNSTLQSSVTLSLTQSQQLMVVVDGYGGNCGSFNLNIQGSGTAKKGLTWTRDDSSTDQWSNVCAQTRVACDDCDGYVGDTLCTEARPLLCINVDGSASCSNPAPAGWTGGRFAVTPFLVYGTQLMSLKAANDICANTFGTGYRMASHHDGGGWAAWGLGGIVPLSTPSSTHPRFGTPNKPNRFWVYISDQPGNCWN